MFFFYFTDQRIAGKADDDDIGDHLYIIKVNHRLHVSIDQYENQCQYQHGQNKTLRNIIFLWKKKIQNKKFSRDVERVQKVGIRKTERIQGDLSRSLNNEKKNDIKNIPFFFII